MQVNLAGTRLLQLYTLHQRRRVLMTDAIRIEYVENNNDANRMLAAIRIPEHHRYIYMHPGAATLAALKHFISSEMEVCSAGSTLMGASFWEDGTIFNHPQSSSAYLKEEIHRIMFTLPRTIGDII